jgi:dTDP-4-amino-4,6-dideoxygalactose transaminase
VNGPISVFPTLDPRTLFASRGKSDPILGRRSARLYASARAAIYRAVRALHPAPASTFLVPSYHCGVEVEAVRRAGCRPVPYRVREDARIDIEDIHERTDPSTVGILVTHYFGFPQDLSTVIASCKEKGLVMLEDCAHALYSRFPDGEWLGTAGDFGAFSLYKTIFLPNGGALLDNRPGAIPPEAGRRHLDLAILKATVRAIMEHEASGGSRLARPSRFLVSRLGSAAGETAADRRRSENGSLPWYYAVPRFDYENGISFVSRRFLSRMPANEVIEARRRNYLLLGQMIEGRGVELLFPTLPDGVCPLAFPVLVDRRDIVESGMRRAGIETYIFGRSLHPLFDDLELREARRLSERAIALPIHQLLGPAEVHRVAGAFLAAHASRGAE